MEQQDFDRACRFINALVAFVQRYGVSSSNMESMLVRVARAVHLRGQFLATPAQVQSILWDVDEDNQRQHLSVTSAGNYDLNKLAQVHELIRHVESGDMTPEAGLERIRIIDRAGPEYGLVVDALAFVLCGLAFGVILGVSWLDVVLGGALSLVSFGLVRLAANSSGLRTALELIVAAVASALATVLALVLPGVSPLAVTVCACIYFVPGFGLTLGASELMNGNTLSGLIGFTRAMVTSGKLVIGALIGSALVRAGTSVPLLKVEAGISDVWTWVFAPVLVLGLAILFRVRRRDLVWPILAGLVVWLGVQVGAGLGYWHGTFIGALLVMSISQVFARVSGLPAVIIMLPAVMLLVPGVAALQAMYAGQTMGLVAGLKATTEVFVLIGAILGGVLCAEAIQSFNQAAVSIIRTKFVHRQPGR